MTIISFDYQPSSKRGGQEKSLFDVLVGLKRKGHHIILAYIEEGDLLALYKENSIECKRIYSFCIQNKLSVKEYIDFVRSVKVLASYKKPFIYINQIKDAPIAALIKKITGGRLVCHLRLPPVGITFQIKLVLKYIDQYIVATRHVFELYTTFGLPPGKITIIPNGFFMDEIPVFSKKKIDKLKIAYVGRIDQTKGIHVLLNACKILKETNHPFVLDIAGAPLDTGQQDYLNNLKEQAMELGIRQDVNFIGHIKNPIKHLNNYTVCIFPSLWDEPFGRVLVESLLAATPVIAHNVGSVSEILNDPEKKWIYNSVDELAEKIQILHAQPDLYEMEDKAAYVRKKYDLKNILEEIEKVIFGVTRVI